MRGERGAFVYKILVYPVKSLPPVELPEARVTEHGTLEWDRVYVIVDEKGRIVNGKREKRLSMIRARYSLKEKRIYLSACCSDEVAFRLDEESEVSHWLSRFLGYRVRLVHVPQGAPDDEEKRGPTIISLATLQELASWFEWNGWDIAQARLRLRANIEIAGVPAFWEDSLYLGGGRGVVFRIGSVRLIGRGISKRCVVPSRDPYTGAYTPGFQRLVVERRKVRLRDRYPAWDHGYRLALNTVVVEGHGSTIRILDTVEVIGPE